MIKEELVIGNWVSKKGFPFKIEALDKYIHGSGHDLEYDAVEPIPLTPEILEKNGFKLMTGFGYSTEHPTFGLAYHDGFREYYSIDITLYNYPISGVKILVRMERNSLCGDGVNKIHSCDIEYIHQLQHALKLCGINKTIEL